MYAVISRKEYPNCCIGTWEFLTDSHDSLGSWKTLELPNKKNKKRVSRIPYGEFHVVLVSCSNSFKYKHFHVLNVPNRDCIKVHIANYVKQLLGCIAPGKKAFDMNGDGIIDISDSTKALKEMLAVAEQQGYTVENKKDFKLIIKAE